MHLAEASGVRMHTGIEYLATNGVMVLGEVGGVRMYARIIDLRDRRVLDVAVLMMALGRRSVPMRTVLFKASALILTISVEFLVSVIVLASFKTATLISVTFSAAVMAPAIAPEMLVAVVESASWKRFFERLLADQSLLLLQEKVKFFLAGQALMHEVVWWRSRSKFLFCLS